MEEIYAISTINIHSNPNALDAVISLWRTNRSTLGFFPEGAFQEYAIKKQIIIATTHDNITVAYLLYRLSEQKASITHLCVNENHRGHKLCHRLFDTLRKHTTGMKGVGLYCRRDFQAANIWPKLGLLPVHEKKGRGKNREVLTYWWLDYRLPSLLTALEVIPQDGLLVAIDANVFYDLDEKNEKQESLESKALSADWFKGEVTISITEEIFSEINRQPCEKERKRQRNRVHLFHLLKTNRADVEFTEKSLFDTIGPPKRLQDASDIRQLAHAISARADFFVTRDAYLLKQSQRVYESFGIEIIRPAEIILEADVRRDEARYKPARLAGTQISLRLAIASDLSRIPDSFCLTSLGEKRNSFGKLIASLVSQPDIYKTYITENIDGKVLAIFAITCNDGITSIPLIRSDDSYLGYTLIRHILGWVLRENLNRQLQWLFISDSFLNTAMTEALQKERFVSIGDKWMKAAVKGLVDIAQLNRLLSLPPMSANSVDKWNSSSIMNAVRVAQTSKDKYLEFELERLIWPGKIAASDIPCYIVPIKAGWARELFDEGLSGQDLLGAPIDIALQTEGVYYFSTRGSKIEAPSRVLWYVSQDKKIPGSCAIRACSLALDIVIDSPKALFKKYRRLGVYTWEDILRTANNDTKSALVAMHFGHTQTCPTPINWETIKSAISGCAGNKTLVSAIRIPEEIFLNLYRLGIINE